MKKALLSLAVLAAAVCTTSAQTLKVHKTDGTVLEIPTADVEYIDVATPAAAAPIYVGEWKVKEFEYTPEEIYNDPWYGMISSFEGWPVYNENDIFTITEDKMTTSLQSELKNYFRPESNLKPSADFDLGGMPHVMLTMVELDNVNRYFSPTEESEDKVALVGFSVNPDDDELLDMYIIDHHSHTFGYPDFDEWTMYGDSKPEATMSGVYVKLTLQRK